MEAHTARNVEHARSALSAEQARIVDCVMEGALMSNPSVYTIRDFWSVISHLIGGGFFAQLALAYCVELLPDYELFLTEFAQVDETAAHAMVWSTAKGVYGDDFVMPELEGGAPSYLPNTPDLVYTPSYNWDYERDYENGGSVRSLSFWTSVCRGVVAKMGSSDSKYTTFARDFINARDDDVGEPSYLSDESFVSTLQALDALFDDLVLEIAAED